MTTISQRLPKKNLLGVIGALPILLPIWVYNGILSVEGLPALWSLLIGEPPTWIAKTFLWAGWATVIVSTVYEVRSIRFGIKYRNIWDGVSPGTIFFGTYDIVTTGLGLYFRLLPSSIPGWVLWLLSVLSITLLVEGVLSALWKEQP